MPVHQPADYQLVYNGTSAIIMCGIPFYTILIISAICASNENSMDLCQQVIYLNFDPVFVGDYKLIGLLVEVKHCFLIQNRVL
jgi:hypothetical protein